MKKNKPEKKKGSKKKLLLIAAAVVIIGAAALSGNSGNKANTGSAETETVKTPEYENVSNSEYVRDGKKCIAYRVSVSSDPTDDELTAVFNDVCNDDYYLHTVWFYSSSELASGGNSYDVAMLEETAAGSDPVITRK